MAYIKHTPGPWVYEDNAIMAECGVHICTPNTADDFPCVEPGTEPDAEAECEANARLMAAAPELLDMLNSIKRHGELACVDAHTGRYFTGGKKPATKDVFQFPRHLLTGVDAAIAKAEGRS